MGESWSRERQYHDDGYAFYGRRQDIPLVPFKTYSAEKLLDELYNEGYNINDFECIGSVPTPIQNIHKNKQMH